MKTIAKKEYTSPVVQAYVIELQQMIASSTLNPDESTPSASVSNETLENDWFSSRESDGDWED